MTELGLVFFVGVFAFGYLFGSIPFGLLLTKVAGAGDLRAIGSGNIGATNVLRTGNKGLAAATLLLDMAKGLAPVCIVAYNAPLWIDGAASAGLGAFMGHLYPIWLKFKGGKGVATFVGVLLGLYWPAALIFAGIWLLTAFVWRYSSLAALVATLSIPVTYLGYGLSGFGFIVLMSLLIFYKHRDNIARLLAGEEIRIGTKST